MDSQRCSIISALVQKWNTVRKIPNPPRQEISAMAEEILDAVQGIPTHRLLDCWTVARGKTQWMPRESELNAAWSSICQQEAPRLENRALPYRPVHSCRYCPVVALRLGTKVPGPSEWEMQAAGGPVTSDELDCVRATLSRTPGEWMFWDRNEKSPYRGML